MTDAGTQDRSTPDSEPRVFLSYAWGGESEAICDRIDAVLAEKGVRLTRDKRDLEFKGSIRDFMRSIGEGQAVIVIISDRYLKSKYCMIELLEIFRQGKFVERIFPMVLSDARIYDPVNLLDYVKYWEDKRNELDRKMRTVDQANLHGIREDLDLYDEIRDMIARLTDVLRDMLTLSPEVLRQTGFAALVEAIKTAVPVAEPPGVASADATPPLEAPGGAMRPNSPFYVQRRSDRLAAGAFREGGATIIIKGPRQVGKSSTLAQLVAVAGEAGKKVAVIDFQLLDDSKLQDDGVFFRHFCSWIASELGLPDRVEAHWRSMLSHKQLCTAYVERQVLAVLRQKLVVAMDEVETLFRSPVCEPFFAMLRNWHNRRATPSSPWRDLDLVLVTSTEPLMFIANVNQSPFNVGDTVVLRDFSAEQVAELNRRHGQPFSPREEQRLVKLVGGHPFLAHKALYQVASGRWSVAGLFAGATDPAGPFGDHLQRLLRLLQKEGDLTGPLLTTIRGKPVSDAASLRLQAAGLVHKPGGAYLPRCRLYAEYFGRQLEGHRNAGHRDAGDSSGV